MFQQKNQKKNLLDCTALDPSSRAEDISTDLLGLVH